MATVLVNDTIKITVTFRSWAVDEGTGSLEDPSSVVVKIYDTSTNPDTLLDTFGPGAPIIKENTAVYSYSWTPDAVGSYLVQFTATFADNSTDIANQAFSVHSVESATPSTSTENLAGDYIMEFAAGLDPLYLDPEELKEIYPDMSTTDLAEQVYYFSLEVKELLGLGDLETPPYIAIEYIKAAAACSISRVNSSATGDEVTMRLGDLSITNRNYTKSNINSGTATTWCELAAALRKEMVAGKSGYRAVVKGARVRKALPSRTLKRY